MAEETRDLDDCISDAKETLVGCLDGGANYLRRHGADNSVNDLIHECADGAVPIYYHDLLDVFGEASELWHEAPDCGFEGDGGILGAIARVIYDAIYSALYEYANELEGDSILCEADGCEDEDDHDEPTDDDPRCKEHCGGVAACEVCAEAMAKPSVHHGEPDREEAK